MKMWFVLTSKPSEWYIVQMGWHINPIRFMSDFDWAFKIPWYFFFLIQSFCCAFASLLRTFILYFSHVGYTWATKQMSSHLPLKYFGKQMNSTTQLLPNKPSSSALHHHAWQLVWGVYANMYNLAFASYGTDFMTKHLHFVLVGLGSTVQQGLEFVHIKLCKPKAVCFLETKGFSW